MVNIPENSEKEPLTPVSITTEKEVIKEEHGKMQKVLEGKETAFTAHFQTERDRILQMMEEKKDRLPQNALHPVYPYGPLIYSEVVEEEGNVGAFTIIYPIDRDSGAMNVGPSVQYRAEAYIVEGTGSAKPVKEIHAWEREEDIEMYVDKIDVKNRKLHLTERRSSSGNKQTEAAF